MTQPMHKPNGQGFGRVIRAAQSSFAGFKTAIIGEAAFGETGLEKALMIASLVLVLIVELLNSAIEATVDRIGLEYHLLSGQAKDMGSAAVFLALVNVAVVWGCIIMAKG